MTIGRTRLTVVALVGMVVLLGVAAALALGAIGWRPTGATGSASTLTPANESDPAATFSPTTSATAEATPEPTPSGPVGLFKPDQIVAVVTTDLLVRTAPGTGADSQIMGDRFNAPTAVFVVDGPSYANGYEWYLVDKVHGQGIGGSPPGWVAAAGKDGEPWLGEDRYTCPRLSEADLLHLERQRALACYGAKSHTIEGTLVGCDAAIYYGPQAWDTGCAVVRRGFDISATPPPCFDCFEPTLGVFFDGDIGLKDLPPGTQVRVQGHFDDPAAQTCRPNNTSYGTRTLAIHLCRMLFVGTRAEVVD